MGQISGFVYYYFGILKFPYKPVYDYYFYIPQVVKVPGVKKNQNQNVGWLEVRQVNWQSVVQKHGVEAL